jgi:hypothetical protein
MRAERLSVTVVWPESLVIEPLLFAKEASVVDWLYLLPVLMVQSLALPGERLRVWMQLRQYLWRGLAPV